MKKKEPSRAKKIISRLITIISVSVFLYAAYGLSDVLIDYYKNRQALSSMQDIYYNVDSEDENRKPDEVRSGFDELLKENDEVVGWITMNGTQIDYPILQSDNNTDYLYRDYNNRETRARSIFLDFRNDITTENKNTVVYGHRMKDGSMFQHLTKYMDEDFLRDRKSTRL